MKWTRFYVGDWMLGVSVLLMFFGVCSQNLLFFGIGYGLFLGLMVGVSR